MTIKITKINTTVASINTTSARENISYVSATIPDGPVNSICV